MNGEDNMETERLILRHFTDNDCEDVFEYASDSEVAPMAGFKPHESIEETKKALQKPIEEKDSYAIVLKTTNKVIGSISIFEDMKYPSERRKSLWFVTNKEYWGHGYGKEATTAVIKHLFSETNCNEITIYHFGTNSRSKSLVSHLGFRYATFFPKAFDYYNGVKLDLIYYRLTKEDFEHQLEAELIK